MIKAKKVLTDEYKTAKYYEEQKMKVEALTNAVVLKGFSPFILNGTWWEYDNESHSFVDTGIVAQGEKGADGEQGIQGERGDKGERGLKGDKGDKGDSYTITEADYEEIAGITEEKIKPSIEELENKKMSYYMVTVSNGKIYHEGEQLNFEQLVEKYHNPSVFLYMEYTHLTLIPNAIADDILAFSTAYFNSIGSNIEQIEINSNNVVTIHYSQLETISNKVGAINTRNKNSETNYPNNKAVTTYVDNVLAKPSEMPTLTDAEKISARQRIGASSFDGNYNNLTNKPTIPTNTNQLTNGANFVKLSDGYEGWRIKGGINSLVNNGQAVSINPAINGLGYCRYRYATNFHIYLDGVEVYMTDSQWNSLFDGKLSTYIRFQTAFTSDTRNIWNATTTYSAGRIICKRTPANEVRWYRALIENTNHSPTDETSNTYWEYLESSQTTSDGRQCLDFQKYNILITLDLDFGTSIAWENGLSLYWRAAAQNAKTLKTSKWNTGTNDWHTTTLSSTYNTSEVVNTVFFGSIPSITTGGNVTRIKLDFTVNSPSWTALNQIAITGLVGGIEGTTLNKGGDAVFGTIYPFVNNTWDLGTGSSQFRVVYANRIQIGSTVLDETKLKKLLALIS